MTPIDSGSGMTRREMLGSLAILAVPAAIASARPAPQGPRAEVAIVDKATDALIEITKIPERGLPLRLLREAQGVVIVPDMIKAGFVFAGRVGRGVLVARDESGSWTNPVFLGVAGGSFGAQIGASASDIVLVFRTKKSVDDFLSRNKVTLGADMAAAAGPVGRDLEASTDLKMRAEILSYSRSRGLFAGVAVNGTSLHIRHRANDAYYGVPNLLVGDVLAGRDADDRPLPVPPSAARLRATLNTLSSEPKVDDRAAEASRPRDNRRRR